MARVLLVFGGQSSEHEVSCESAVSVFEALDAGGHRVVPVGISRDGEWFLVDTSFRPFRAEGRPVSLAIPDAVLKVGGDVVEFDVAFPVLHGPMGEDGTLQGMFEMAGVPYVGCDVRASAVTMDKDLSKRLVEAAGIPTSPWRTIRRREWLSDAEAVAEAVAHGLRFPLFVKPSAQGSSVGISKAGDTAQLLSGVANAFRYDTKVVVEEAVVGREIEVAVLDGPRASVPSEIIVTAEFYTYEAKYADDTSQCIAPADLGENATKTVRAMAEAIFDLFGLTGLARVDFFYERATNQFLFNEVNTMPGFTSISGFPKMWLASGMTYEQLCSHLVDAALDRFDDQRRLAMR
ncbi:MAG: D-alanine--D-alanine ligase [Acidimicrobiia bacterium]|nr:D-alanine--D-alanine ligase [Acidimicrobiia bacterium]